MSYFGSSWGYILDRRVAPEHVRLCLSTPAIGYLVLSSPPLSVPYLVALGLPLSLAHPCTSRVQRAGRGIHQASDISPERARIRSCLYRCCQLGATAGSGAGGLLLRDKWMSVTYGCCAALHDELGESSCRCYRVVLLVNIPSPSAVVQSHRMRPTRAQYRRPFPPR